MKQLLLAFIYLFLAGCSHQGNDLDSSFEQSFLFTAAGDFQEEVIEAEDYSGMKDVETSSFVGYIDAGDKIWYEDVVFGEGRNFLHLTAASKHKGGRLEFRLDSTEGEVIAIFEMPGTGDWLTWKEFKVPLSRTVSGVHDLYIIGIKGDGILNLDKIRFSTQPYDFDVVVNKDQGDWTLVTVSDTQHYSQNTSKAPFDHMMKAFTWIADSRDMLNIKMVQGLGDVTQNWSHGGEWNRSKSAWMQLHGKIPYMPVMGNHDSPEAMNRYFPISMFEGFPWWGGSFGGIENNYVKMCIGGENYIFLQVEPYDQYSTYRPEGIRWAKEILGRYPDRKVILATHDIWDTNHIRTQLLEKYDNIIMSNAGHTCVREKRFQVTGPNGGVSHNFVTDYQCDEREVMLLRLYVFRPQKDRVDFFTYSPVTKSFERDESSQGSFSLAQKHIK